MKRITREDLEKMIYPNDYYYCSNHNCLPTTLKQCQECCNKALTEYENEIYNKALENVLKLIATLGIDWEVQNSDIAWLEKSVKDLIK